MLYIAQNLFTFKFTRMKKLWIFTTHITISYFWVVISAQSYAQTSCLPLAPTGYPNVYPPTENLSCIERGIAYSEVIHIENFNTFNTVLGTAQLNYLIIDSFTNLPCNLQWDIVPRDSLGPSETACINIYGTTNDSVGQYRVRIYVTVSVFIPGLGNIVLSDEAETLVRQVEQFTGTPTGINFKYYLRVIEAGNNCPQLDTTSTALNRIACGGTPLSVALWFSPDTICRGSSAQLHASATGGMPPYTYRWSPGYLLNDSTIANPIATPQTTTTFNVVVSDQQGTTIQRNKTLVVEICSHINKTPLGQQKIIIPNPVTDGRVFIILSSSGHAIDEPLHLSVWNMEGKVLYSETLFPYALSNSKYIDCSHLSKGMYFLHLSSHSHHQVEKIIIQ